MMLNTAKQKCRLCLCVLFILLLVWLSCYDGYNNNDKNILYAKNCICIEEWNVKGFLLKNQIKSNKKSWNISFRFDQLSFFPDDENNLFKYDNHKEKIIDHWNSIHFKLYHPYLIIIRTMGDDHYQSFFLVFHWFFFFGVIDLFSITLL